MYSYLAQSTIQLAALLAVNITTLALTSFECRCLASDIGIALSSYTVLLTLGLILAINSGNIPSGHFDSKGVRKWMDENIMGFWYLNFWLSYASFNWYVISRFSFYWSLILIPGGVTLMMLMSKGERPKQ